MAYNPYSLEGKSILVTGASSGIGRETCAHVARMGGRVIATGRDRARLAETIEALDGDGHEAIDADLTRAEDRTSLVESVARAEGVVHSAGITKHVPFLYVTEKHLRDIHAVNFDAPLLLTRELVKARRVPDGGSVVFVASTAGLAGLKAMAAYAGSKGALIASVRVMALELAPRKIRVNCLAPGMVETPMAEQTAEAVSSVALEEHRRLYPLGFGRPEDVANAAVFLLSAAGRWITGTALVVDGGFTCQ